MIFDDYKEIDMKARANLRYSLKLFGFGIKSISLQQGE
jgi:hypothetical protein